MKKLLTIIILLLILMIPFKVKAEDKSYDINKLLINAEITKNGDVEVHEELTYNFHGNFNGFYRDLSKNATSGYTIENIALKDKNNKMTNLVSSQGEENNSYKIIDSDDNTQVKIFSKSDNEIKTFILNYRINSAAVKYKDLGELYWKFYTVENNIPIKTVEFNLSLMNTKFDLNKMKYWTYTDGNEFNTNYDQDGIHIKGNNLTSVLGIKLHFPSEFLTIDNKGLENTNYQDAKKSDGFANDRNNSGDQAAVIIAVLAVVSLISVLSLRYLRNKKKFQKAISDYREGYIFFDGNRLVDPPEDISPALVSLLYNEEYISRSVIPAVLLYLCKKGYYSIEKGNYKFAAKNVDKLEDFKFRQNAANIPDSIHLKFFISWFQIYEENGVISLKKLQEMIKNHREEAREFKNQYSNWEDMIIQEGESLGFFTEIENKRILTNEAYNKQLKWKAYKNYIKDYIAEQKKVLDYRNIDEILIYAVALDMDKDSLKFYSEKLLYGNNNTENIYLDELYYYPYFYSNLILWDDIDSNINHFTSDSGGSSSDFGGFSGGGDCYGGGGGGSGAF
ncbi:MAG: DUF2207 domain-containing protein [Clostridium sp.]|uniref:DUF2207 domain-containing protein n=1 Tax=Clostridium sp. TaxID=1506 RepID=UPI0039ECC05B